ncbi:hypothetical protein DUNSADRAFT_13686 [Dunaliella salina]|uniref:Hpc2-related domain-containing protein n=1 Tax=Dunaliella salina TaxID=3046 RepID=A0ABQ7G8Z1_DUNSA|nr:hypothetical protein DUNSADRAFT_13686 [Dunaliella salina]|eukprot:KAF5831035.1 hypothetical protein DUNSADRAFT_13686 [Dunaliella salina]
MLGAQQHPAAAPRRIAPLPVHSGTTTARQQQVGGGAGVLAGAAAPGQTTAPASQHPRTPRMHVDLSVCSVVSYSKEKKKLRQASHPPGCETPPDSDSSSSDSEGSSSDAGSEDSDQKGSSGSEMEEASCASDAAVTSGGEGGVRGGSGGRSSDKGGHKPRRRRAKRQKLVTYEADFVDDTEVLEARAATKEPKYGSVSNGFYVNQGRIETLEDEAEAKEAATKGKGRGPRASRAAGTARDKDARQGAASADELPVRKRAGAADQAKSSADEHPLGNKKRKPDGEQSKPTPAPKKAKKAADPPTSEGPNAPPRAPASAATVPPASPPSALQPAPAASTQPSDAAAFPPNMSLAQRAALAVALLHPSRGEHQHMLRGPASIVHHGSITSKLRDLTKASGTQEAPTVSAMKQALKHALASLAMALHRDGNPPEDHAAVVQALAHEGGALWPNPEAVAAELKTLQDRQLGSLASLRDSLREQLASGTGIVLSPAGADGTPCQQDLTPQALGIWEKLLALQRKLHGVTSEGPLLEEVASWGAAQGATVAAPAAAAVANSAGNPECRGAGPSSHSPDAAQPATSVTDLVPSASCPNPSHAPHTLGSEAALPPRPQQQQHRQQDASAPATVAAATEEADTAPGSAAHAAEQPGGSSASQPPAAGTAPGSAAHAAHAARAARAAQQPGRPSTAPRPGVPSTTTQPGGPSASQQPGGPLPTSQPPGGPSTSQPPSSNERQGDGAAADTQPRAVSGEQALPPASHYATGKPVGVSVLGSTAAAATNNQARNGEDAVVEGRDDAVRDGEGAHVEAAAAAAAGDSSGAEGEGEGTSGPADDEPAPAAANGAANGARDKGSSSGSASAQLPGAAEEATMLEAALAQASSKGGNADLLSAQYKIQVSIYSKAVLKALCYAGAEGFSTKDIRQHIQQHGYLVNWKGDTSSISQALKTKKMSPILAHIGGYRYALRAFPGVDDREQEKPVRADRQGHAQSHGKPSGGQPHP